MDTTEIRSSASLCILQKPILADAKQKFWEKVEKTSSCWIWTGRIEKSGYAYTSLLGVKTLVQRIAWVLVNGNLPSNHIIKRTCTSKRCVNPKHMKIIGIDCEHLGKSPTPLQDRMDCKMKVDTENGCWLWTGKPGRGGYGYLSVRGRNIGVHRISAMISLGYREESGLCVLHKCDVPLCFNPDHLFIGTKGDNNRDSADKGRSRYSKRTHCQSGHPLSGQNLSLLHHHGRTYRRCKECHRREERERKVANKQAA
jgi:hypothetical protein